MCMRADLEKANIQEVHAPLQVVPLAGLPTALALVAYRLSQQLTCCSGPHTSHGCARRLAVDCCKHLT